jgi:predicted N-acyltransferase
VAAALNLIGGDIMYGRYWGTEEYLSGLHFETCYMQSIAYCIAHGLSRFEGGAQGEHKISRGLVPTPTWSALDRRCPLRRRHRRFPRARNGRH